MGRWFGTGETCTADVLKLSMVSEREAVRVRPSSAESGRPGAVDVELVDGETVVSSCEIVPLSLRIGRAVVRMDGIADVKTAEEHRYRGFARRVLTRAMQRMEEGDASLTMLYGITDFYPKFGYTTVGPESTIALTPLDEAPDLLHGYQVRPFEENDLPAMQRLYDQLTARSVGAAIRPRDGYPWTALLETPAGGASTNCRVIVESGSTVVAYVWRGENLRFVRAHSRYNPDDLVLGEVVAVEPSAADVALTVARRWAAEESERRGRDCGRVLFFTPHQGPVAAAAMQIPSTLSRGYGPDGGWMARVLSTRRLLSSLQPELCVRLAEARNHFHGDLQILTETGDVTLHIDGDRVEASAPSNREVLVCRLPQTTLARLALGSYPPDDLLARLPDPPEGTAAELLQMMFPPRPAQIFLADRF